MKKTKIIVFKNATLTENQLVETKVKKVNGVEVEEEVFKCSTENLFNIIDDMGTVKLEIKNESSIPSEDVKSILKLLYGLDGLNLKLTQESEEEL